MISNKVLIIDGLLNGINKLTGGGAAIIIRPHPPTRPIVQELIRSRNKILKETEERARASLVERSERNGNN